jgi:exopolysaccharide biosynthesis protein
MFTGKGLHDRHPRTAMGYTADGRLIILVIQGRMKGLAEGASLMHEALILKDLGCVEALNLDGGGSSCMLVNGRETIKPSDATGQRPVPAVFIIKKKGI